MAKKSIWQELFNHHRYIGTGEFYVADGDPDEVKQERQVRDEHWGRKEDCAKCRRLRNNIGEFKNTLTYCGWFYVGLIGVVTITAVVASVLICNFG